MSLERIVSAWKTLNIWDSFALAAFIMIILFLIILLYFVLFGKAPQ